MLAANIMIAISRKKELPFIGLCNDITVMDERKDIPILWYMTWWKGQYADLKSCVSISQPYT